jgi:hypothetical protein
MSRHVKVGWDFYLETNGGRVRYADLRSRKCCSMGEWPVKEAAVMRWSEAESPVGKMARPPGVVPPVPVSYTGGRSAAFR